MKETANDTTVYVRDATGNVMSVYYKPGGGSLVQSEMHLYGSSRLGMATQHLAPDTVVILNGGFGSGIKSIFTRGEKFFELSNHLSNVLATVSDRRVQVDANSDGTVDSYKADIVSANDYYPFGMLMPGRKYSIANTNYRYGFNGKENDKDIENGVQDYGMRIYDGRLGRFLSDDPITKKYPELTPYQFSSNRPIAGVDLDGLEFYYAADGNLIAKSHDNNTQVRVIKSENVQAAWQLLRRKEGATTVDLNKISADAGMKNEELNTRAFLTMLRKSEGTLGEKGYKTQFGGGQFSNFKDHPNEIIKRGKYSSSAAGAYQILSKTWNSKTAVKIKNTLGISDFSPESQDKFGLWLIDNRGALNNVISGDVEGSIRKTNKEWASLPESPYGQPTQTMEGAKAEFKKDLSNELNGKSDIATPKGKLEDTINILK